MRIAALLLCLSLVAGCQTAAKHENEAKQAKSANLHYQLGVDALNKNNMPKAFDELLQAQQLAPARADILDALGVAWIVRGDLKKAETYFKQALQHSPSAATYNNYGGLLMQMGAYAKAETFFRKALDDPRYRNPDLVYINLGDALVAQGRFDEAISSFRQSRRLNPRQELSRLKEAQAYEQSSRKHYAKALYEAILREQPASRPAMQGLLGLLESSGNLTEARRGLRKFRKQSKNPEDVAWASGELQRLSSL